MEMDWTQTLDWRLKRIARFSEPAASKILFIVLDGLGGAPHPDYVAAGPFDTGGAKSPKSELEWASLHGKIDHLNAFARDAKTVTGRIYPAGKGFTPGSVAGHLGIFGYDPDHYLVKRGPVEAAALEGVVEPGDVIARFNFCRIDKSGKVVDRRAGRMKDAARAAALAGQIEGNLKIPEARIRVISTAEHRGVVILRKNQRSDPPLSEHVTDTDPGVTGQPVVPCQPFSTADKPSKRTAAMVQKFSQQVRESLSGEPDANMLLLRGFGTMPTFPHFSDVYNVRAAAIARYPAYRGLASMLGMTLVGDTSPGGLLAIGGEFGSEVDVLREHYDEYDFFFLHYKLPDEKGEDRDFLGKVESLHKFDIHLPRIRELRFQVIVITGDHATPALLGRHSHHSVPLAMYSERVKGYDRSQEFTEQACLSGARGSVVGPELMPIVLGNADRLRKFEE
jgi:2,3-bisphosphoglycerate-independent phosphoglycerate mutase